MLISNQYRREKVLKYLRLADDDHRDVCVSQSGEETRPRKTADGAHQPGPFSWGPFHWRTPRGLSADGPRVHCRFRRRKKIFPKKFSSTKRTKENKGHQLIASFWVRLGRKGKRREHLHRLGRGYGNRVQRNRWATNVSTECTITTAVTRFENHDSRFNHKSRKYSDSFPILSSSRCDTHNGPGYANLFPVLTPWCRSEKGSGFRQSRDH